MTVAFKRIGKEKYKKERITANGGKSYLHG